MDLDAVSAFRIKMIFSASLGVRRTYAVPPKSPPSLKMTSRFRPLDAAPLVTGRSFGEPELPTADKVTVTCPSSEASKSSKLVLVVSPHVPDCSPVAISSIPLFVV